MEIVRNACGYAPLLVNLAFYWKTPFEKLPAHLRSLVAEAYFPYHWKDLTAEGRLQIAKDLDADNDPDREPALRFALGYFKSDLQEQIKRSREKDKDAVTLALEDMAKKIDKLLSEEDRIGIGEEVKRLRLLQAELPATQAKIAECNSLMEANAALKARLEEIEATTWKGFDPESDTYPEELDIAMQAWRAVEQGWAEPGEKPKQKIKDWLESTYPKLTVEARERIAIVANWKKGAGRPPSGQK